VRSSVTFRELVVRHCVAQLRHTDQGHLLESGGGYRIERAALASAAYHVESMALTRHSASTPKADPSDPQIAFLMRQLL